MNCDYKQGVRHELLFYTFIVCNRLLLHRLCHDCCLVTRTADSTAMLHSRINTEHPSEFWPENIQPSLPVQRNFKMFDFGEIHALQFFFLIQFQLLSHFIPESALYMQMIKTKTKQTFLSLQYVCVDQ